MVNLYDFITRDLGTNKSHVFSVKSADLDNALASLELQYEASVGSYAACEIMNVSVMNGINIPEPEYQTDYITPMPY